MPGRITSSRWPPWPQLIFNPFKHEPKPEDEQYQKLIGTQYGSEALRRSWIETCKELNTITENIVANGNSVIPILELDEILDASESVRDRLRAIGCFVVRGAVPRTQATEWYHELKGYVEDNKGSITGMHSSLQDIATVSIGLTSRQACPLRDRSCTMSTTLQHNKLPDLIPIA
jgi:hypothetical protein